MFKSIKKFLKEIVGIPCCILLLCVTIGCLILTMYVRGCQEELYSNIMSQVKFVRSAVDMVCCDIKQQDVEVGIDEPFRVETRYYLRAKDKTAGYACYVTEPLALNDTVTQYTVKAVLPKVSDVNFLISTPFEQQAYTVQYYVASDEDSQRAKLTAEVEASVQRYVSKTIKITVFTLRLLFVATLSVVGYFSVERYAVESTLSEIEK